MCVIKIHAFTSVGRPPSWSGTTTIVARNVIYFQPEEIIWSGQSGIYVYVRQKKMNDGSNFFREKKGHLLRLHGFRTGVDIKPHFTRYVMPVNRNVCLNTLPPGFDFYHISLRKKNGLSFILLKKNYRNELNKSKRINLIEITRIWPFLRASSYLYVVSLLLIYFICP